MTAPSDGTFRPATGKVITYQAVRLIEATSQELLTGTIWTPNGSTYPESTGNWIPVRATTYDGLDRALAQYEAGFGDTPKTQNTYDSSGAAGLLTATKRATGEIRSNVYDALGRLTDVSYTGDSGLTPAMQMAYDADGRVTSRSTAVLGAEALMYDATGNVLSITEPASLGSGLIGYDYYADGTRKDVTYMGGTYSVNPVAQYGYRSDGKRDMVKLSNGSAFAWTYTAAGRELTESDPFTGTSISPTTTYVVGRGAPRNFYPPTMTYIPRSSSYDTNGRLLGLALPESPFSYTYGGAQYDLEDNIAEETRNLNKAATKSVCVISNVRNEKVANGGQRNCSAFTTPTLIPHIDLNGMMLDGGNWAVDARTGLKLNDQVQDQRGVTVGSAYSYDLSGRLTQDAEAADGPCSPGYQYSSMQYPYCYRYGTRTKTYYAENRLKSDVYPMRIRARR